MIYFAYCTLLDLNEMKKYCPAALVTGVGRLRGYRLTFATYHTGSTGGGCQLEPEPSGEIFGVLYELNAGDAANLDAVSGVDKGYYTRVDIRIDTLDGRMVPATTYIIPAPGGRFRPSPNYVRPILNGARALNLPAAYVAKLEAIVKAEAMNDR